MRDHLAPVTYWGLRDYGTATWEGGDEACQHLEMALGMSEKNTLGPSGYLPATNAANVGRWRQFREVCGSCGARRIDRQIGLEPTPDAYVAALVAVFREVRRVLRDDGTLWLNLGDSYAAGKAGRTDYGTGDPTSTAPDGLKPKDLVGIPWRVAFALQADGWYLRQDIVWAKPNPMPESVTDRCTKAHEYVFLLAKSARYYWDQAAMREPLQAAPHAPGNIRLAGGKTDSGHLQDRIWGASGFRNRRSVWTVATQPYSGAHFAVMPEALVLPCVLAATRPGDLVLDPFAGTGTVLDVAQRHGRRGIGCDLAYHDLSRERIAQRGLVFA